MAEVVIFGGSPLDQYLQQAEAPELDEASTPPIPSSASEDYQEASSGSASAKSQAHPLAARSDRVPNGNTQRDDHSKSISPSDVAELRNGGGRPTTQSQSSTAPSQDSLMQITTALRDLIHTVLLPLVLLATRKVVSLTTSQHTLSNFQSNPKQPAASIPAISERKSTSSAHDDGGASFAEKFKYAICSSFLLTPSLSISFYDSASPLQTRTSTPDAGAQDAVLHERVRGGRASASPIRKACFVEPDNASASLAWPPATSTTTPETRLPRLDAQGRAARNAACISALMLLPPISGSWTLWLSTVLTITCLTWSFVLFLGHSIMDDTLHFTLSHSASPLAVASTSSLRSLNTSTAFRASEKVALQRSVLADVKRLIRAAQHFDLSINKAISAIQEVEIVSRGYKLTHPLPPISRIEAAAGSAVAWSDLASPSRQRRVLAAPTLPATGKLSRTLSGGRSSAPTIKRHTQRPLSLTLSSGRASPFDRSSGRASPAVLGELADPDMTQKLLAEQSTVASVAADLPPPQRLVELRKNIVAALDETAAACASSLLPLQELADPEEVASLHELYALDAAPLDDSNEADVSQAWSVADTSALSDGFANLDADRKTWVATTPRNFGSNIRSADANNASDASWRSDFSPQVGPSSHKRLSLVSDAGSVLDRPPRTISSLSRRSSLVSDSGAANAYRSPRLNYVSDKSSAPSGPNESAAAKRLSYISNSSAATGSISPMLRNSSMVSSVFTPPHSSLQTYSAATSPQSRATKRSSILGPNSIFAHVDPAAAGVSRAEPLDPLSLLSIKAKFEHMHRARRRWLCHLLALPLRTADDVVLPNGASLPLDEYWTAARAVISGPSALLSAKEQDVKDAVAKEMGGELFGEKRRGSAPPASTDRPESRNGGLTVPGAETGVPSIVGHPGLEDRLHAMMLSLRSLQAKIRVCAEDISVSVPPGLHGVGDGPSRSPEHATQTDDRTRIVQLERTMESMRDDLLGLSAEWEASIKLLHKEKRRSPSPHLGSEVESELASFRGARDLQSPLEADEDAATTPGQAETSRQDEGESALLHQQDGSDDEDDGDLAELLLRSTSPNSLPPPGLEQVFESIAGMAGLSGLGGADGKASRAERIELARRQREEKQAADKAAHRHTLDPSSMMSELSDVIHTRRAMRDQRHHSVLSPIAPGDTFSQAGIATNEAAAHEGVNGLQALALGSPLDLGSAGKEGVFEASHSYAEGAMPRRSLSSLDLARARALQTLEARSPSVQSAASNSFEMDDDEPRGSGEFSFEPTALESVPEDEAGAALALASPSAGWDSTSRKSTPKASAGLTAPGQESPFDLGAQVAAYARRKAAAKAAAMHTSDSQSSFSSQS
ncbi:uncharacterized protein PAN0_017c5450 [Moesziomyces antarcticus]|uniref:Uncharacterized protein n=2 Tax=Pseudozyma antarctica TaxID=84753 RepID=A0A5C3FUQ9_PSEA2|nr:uncharacterized protein PAN0_017c5450 [Moesziomyces antarcticus]GAK67224.1 conserved hypothetical protein [Moesziomyces antarcticus]SPO48168.1 uncharacterized protein PSANT_05856 [Moesziomyces antarcticus]